jgi:hypothetical protein
MWRNRFTKSRQGPKVKSMTLLRTDLNTITYFSKKGNQDVVLLLYFLVEKLSVGRMIKQSNTDLWQHLKEEMTSIRRK